MERRACVDHLVYIVFVAAGMKYLLPAGCRRFQQRRMFKDVRSARTNFGTSGEIAARYRLPAGGRLGK